MSDTLPNIGFILRAITTDQFAIIDTHYRNDGTTGFTTEIVFTSNAESRIIIVTAKYLFAQDENPFLILEASCHFEIAEASWPAAYIQEDKHFRIPKGFSTHLAILTVGTARGIMHAKTEKTVFNKYIVPMINLTEIITDDTILKADQVVEAGTNAS